MYREAGLRMLISLNLSFRDTGDLFVNCPNNTLLPDKDSLNVDCISSQ